jgi:hypothetical protein
MPRWGIGPLHGKRQEVSGGPRVTGGPLRHADFVEEFSDVKLYVTIDDVTIGVVSVVAVAFSMHLLFRMVEEGAANVAFLFYVFLFLCFPRRRRTFSHNGISLLGFGYFFFSLVVVGGDNLDGVNGQPPLYSTNQR